MARINRAQALRTVASSSKISPTRGDRVRKAARFVVEALERRQLLTSTWNVLGGSGNWNSNPNFTPTTGFPNSTSAAATFHVATTVPETITLGTNITVNSLTVGSTNVESETFASGNTLTFGGTSPTLTQSGTSPVYFSCGIALASNLTIVVPSGATLTISGNIDTAGHTLTFNGAGSVIVSGVVSNSTGTGSIIDEGDGSLTLSGTNTYSGATTVTNSTLIVSNTSGSGTGSGNVAVSGASGHSGIVEGTGSISGGVTFSGAYVALNSSLGFPSTSGILTLASGSTLTLSATVTSAMTLTENFALAGNATISNPSSYTLTLSGNMDTAGHTLTVGGAGNTVLSGVISNSTGSGGITESGEGSLTLSGTNTYSGTTTVTDSTLILSNTSGSGTGSGNVTVSGASGHFGIVGGAGSISGGVTFSGGYAALNPSLGFPSTSSALTLASGSILTLPTTATAAMTLTENFVLGGNATISNPSSYALTLSGNIDTAGHTLTVGGDGNTVFSGVISNSTGSGGITDSGEGSLTLSGTNTYSGTTTVTDSTLILSNTSGSATGTGNIAISGASGHSGILGGTGSLSGGITFSGGYTALNSSLGFPSTSGTVTLASACTLTLPASGSATLTISENFALASYATISNASSYLLTLSGNIDTAGHVLTVDGGGNFTLSGVVSNSTGSGGITETGYGSLTLSGSNTYTGTTMVTDSTLILANGSGSATGSGNISLSGTALDPDVFGGTGSVSGIVTFGAYSYLSTSLGLTISSGALTIGGGSLLILPASATSGMTLTGNIALNSYATIENLSSYLLTLSGNINTAGHILTVDGGGNFTLSGSSTGSGGITETGYGSLTLSGSNTYTGTTTVTDSTLILANGSGSATVSGNMSLSGTAANPAVFGGTGSVSGIVTFGAYSYLSTSLGLTISSGALTIGAGSVLILPASATSGMTLTGNIALNNYATIENLSSHLLTLSGNIDTAGHILTVDGGGNFALSGVVSNSTGSGGITETGYGSLTLSGANTYSGATTITDSTFVLANTSGSATGSGNITVTGTGAHPAFFGGTGSLTGVVTFFSDSYLSQPLGLTITSGALTLNTSTIRLPAGTSAPMTVAGNIVMNASVTIDNLSSQALTFSGNIDTQGHALTINDTAGVVLSGVISNSTGSGTLTYSGGGSLTLSGANTYTGITTITDSTLILANTSGSATGSGTVYIFGTSGSPAGLSGTGAVSGAITVVGPCNLSSTLDGSAFASGGINLAGNAVLNVSPVSGTSLTLASNMGIYCSSEIVSPTGDTLTLTGNINSSYGYNYLTIEGAASVAVDGTVTYGGGTIVAPSGSITYPGGIVPQAPTAVSAESYSAGDGRLAWFPQSDATTFTIQDSTNGGTTFQTVAVIPGTANSFLPTGLLPNTTYTYRIEATDSAGNSLPSANAAMTTQGQYANGIYEITEETIDTESGVSISTSSAPVVADSAQEAILLRTIGSVSQADNGETDYTLGGFEQDSEGTGYYGDSYGFDGISNPTELTYAYQRPIRGNGDIDGDEAPQLPVDWSDDVNIGSGTSGTGLEYLWARLVGSTDGCDCNGCCPGSEATSANPIAFSDGSPSISATDLTSAGFSGAWNITRNFTTQSEYLADNSFGYGWMNDAQTHLQEFNTETTTGNINVVNGAYAQVQFNYNGSTYAPAAISNDTLTHNSTAYTYAWLQSNTGDSSVYYDFSSSTATNLQGKLKSWSDAAGDTIGFTYNSSGRLTTVTQTDAAGDNEYFNYTYFTSGANAGQISTIQQSMKRVGAGSPTVYRQVVYTYYQGTYTGDDQYGNQGDLKTVKIEDGSANVISESYYRYYTPADIAASEPGYVGGLKYVFNSDNFAKLVAAYSDPFSATDADVAPYANNYFQYNMLKQVTEEVADSAGASSNNGQGTIQYSYYQNPSFPTSGTPGFNTWWMRTTETMPDGNQTIVYTNINKQTLLTMSIDSVDAGSPSTIGVKEITAYQYNSYGQLIATIEPSAANTSFYTTPVSYEAYGDVGITEGGAAASSGLVETTAYYSSTTATSSTAGGVANYVEANYVQQGLSGTPVEQDSVTYYANTDSNGNTIYPKAADTVYSGAGGTGAETTNYAYVFYSGTNQPYSIATSAPVISSGENGPGSADVTTDVCDVYGNVIWVKDPNGYISYHGIDLATGATVQTITDVNTGAMPTLVDDVVTLPTGWTTPTGGGLNLITSMQVDNLGRTTEVTSPNGNVTYTVYNDPTHQVRIYPGWNATTGTTTGPTEIIDQNWPLGYTEALTTSDAPAVSGTSGSYVPTGAETITAGNIQSLTRSLMNDSDQVIETDKYFTMSGISTYSTSNFYLGTAGTNYYTTTYAYDAEGRKYITTEPTGTIDVAVYDGFDRPVSSWVGTNATTSDSNPFNGGNVGTGNNMTEVSSEIYDNGGAGDSLVTQTTTYPGGSAPNRVTQNAYDWRDRLVETKSGVQSTEDTTTHRPITYITYDNLSEPTEQQTFDGDTVQLSTLGATAGVPNAPSASLLRAESTQSFDDQGRVYASTTYSVDPSTGSVGSGITTNIFRDHDGNVIATFTPGSPTTKSMYDGANRAVTTYITDGGAVNNSGTPLLDWTDAGSVANDVVVSETDTTLDADGNAILTTTEDRLPTASTTTEGVLTSTLARITYVADYYDAADRMTATENVGTNGGSTWIRPSSPDSSDDTHLVTTYGYDAGGHLNLTTDPRGIESLTVFDMLGRQTTTIAAYTGGSATPTSSTNQTTDYTYDGNNDVLSMTAVMPSGSPSQTTDYVYGFGVSGGLYDNDLLVGIQYPDPTTGYASGASSNDVGYGYNNLGEKTSMVDQNGTFHAYAYDVLARETLDAVTTLGSGVDSSVLALGYNYNTQGLPYQQTSYSSATTFTSGTTVNQDQDVYNGFGQLTGEYQSVSGVVNTPTTPEVQYAYSSAGSGSNPTELVYPNGRILHYGYDNNTLDTAIGRVDYLADDNGSGGVGSHLADYGYLGLSSVLSQADANGVTLTDTLDQFGRVAEAKWVNTSTSTSTDDFAYGYDRAGNVLYKNNVVSSSFSELYHANSATTGDGNTAYDPLGRLTGFSRGTLTSSGNNGSTLDTVTSGNLNTLAGSSQSFSLDAVGNQTSTTTDGTATTKTQNSKNELTGVGSATLAYDNNGNTTTDASGHTLTYDAWNRMVTDSAGTTSYAFDANGRRVIETHGSATTALYFTTGGQVIEERVAGTITAQNVWSIDYVNSLLLRDDNSTSGNLGISGSGLGTRAYYQHDANYNVTSTLDTGANVVQRYVYTPYGIQSVLTAAWATSAAANSIYGFQGGRLDLLTGLLRFGARDYDPATAIWIEMDPARYVNGPNMYQFVNGSPAGSVDPHGLWTISWGDVATGVVYGAAAVAAASLVIAFAPEIIAGAAIVAGVDALTATVVAGAIVDSGIIAAGAETVGLTAAAYAGSEVLSGEDPITGRALSDGERSQALGGLIGGVGMAEYGEALVSALAGLGGEPGAPIEGEPQTSTDASPQAGGDSGDSGGGEPTAPTGTDPMTADPAVPPQLCRGKEPEGGLPGSKAIWGRNRLIKELHDGGYVLKGPTTGPGGLIYTNPGTGESVRIMPRPDGPPPRSAPPEKYQAPNYYRYQQNPNQPWGRPTPLPGSD